MQTQTPRIQPTPHKQSIRDALARAPLGGQGLGDDGLGGEGAEGGSDTSLYDRAYDLGRDDSGVKCAI